MKSPIRWVGGKSWFQSAFDYIVRDVKYGRLVELFAGGGAISFGRSETYACLNDTNPALYAFYRAIQEGWFPLTPTGDVDVTMYMRRRDSLNMQLGHMVMDPRTVADDFYFLNKYCFNGLWRVNASGKFNVPWNRKAFVAYPNFEPYRTILQGWDLDCRDYSLVPLRATDLVFADPPYDSTFVGYTTGGFGWAEQLELARYLVSINLPVVTTNAATPRILALYRDLGFTVGTLEAPRRVAANGDRAPALEMFAHRNLGAHRE